MQLIKSYALIVGFYTTPFQGSIYGIKRNAQNTPVGYRLGGSHCCCIKLVPQAYLALCDQIHVEFEKANVSSFENNSRYQRKSTTFLDPILGQAAMNNHALGDRFEIFKQFSQAEADRTKGYDVYRCIRLLFSVSFFHNMEKIDFNTLMISHSIPIILTSWLFAF